MVDSESDYIKKYGVTQENSEAFNIYTPLTLSTEIVQDDEIIDQIAIERNNGTKTVIQANSKFTVKFSNELNGKNSVYKPDKNEFKDFTRRYRKVTYIKFDFAVNNVEYVGITGSKYSFGLQEANTWIGPIYGDDITVVPYLNTVAGDSVTDSTFNYYVVSAAVNTNDSWTKKLLESISTSLDDLNTGDDAALIEKLYNICGNEGKKKISYYADTKGELLIVNRIYDFRVTDVKDLDWKNVFRNNTSATFVNQHSGIAYYAGINKWNTNNPAEYNQIIGRSSDEIGTTPARILPVGPYKNTDTTYISAPKMGYRFSFDLKVTGTASDKKYVKITPSFYYISKDGKTLYSEYTSGKEGIYLFYKNNNGQYVRIGSASDNYRIQFTPNDGYRALIQTDIKNLNSKVVTLGSLTSLKLNCTETTTVSENDAAITYYGEYKLPNSTIAVKVNSNGKYDINKPLTNGYIGVVFDIQAHEADGVDLVYGKNSYKAEDAKTYQENTSQWDYEGYLGISKPGEKYSTTLKLEKGTWNIDNATYNKIKGTVILYDTDQRASNDFN